MMGVGGDGGWGPGCTVGMGGCLAVVDVRHLADGSGTMIAALHVVPVFIRIIITVLAVILRLRNVIVTSTVTDGVITIIVYGA